MLFAAVALRYAFPVSVYAGGDVAEGFGRSVTMQSLSNSLKVSQQLPVLLLNALASPVLVLTHFVFRTLTSILRDVILSGVNASLVNVTISSISRNNY